MTVDDDGILELSVAQFSLRLAQLIAKQPKLQRIAIVGEVSRWSPQQNGNLYFTLKDDGAALSCFAFGSDVARFPDVRDGVAVRAVGSIGVREQRSEYQLRVVQLELTGIGALAAQVEELREKLRAEGNLDESRRRAIPRFVRTVALVTAAGDAREDFERRIRQYAPRVKVVFVQTHVQGKGAAVEIAQALDDASRMDVDAVVLTRGGGSYEDRFAFNLEPVVRAILRNRHPVITAIGHARDHHLADDVADLVVATPTAAAEQIVSEWMRARERLSALEAALTRAFRDVVIGRAQRVDTAKNALRHRAEARIFEKSRRLHALAQSLQQNSPAVRLSRDRERLANANARVAAARSRYFAGATARVESAKLLLFRDDPLRPLERGYAIVYRGESAVRDASQVAAGDAIRARLGRGTLDARVERVEHDG